MAIDRPWDREAPHIHAGLQESCRFYRGGYAEDGASAYSFGNYQQGKA
jgi:hypothetical protein